MIYEVINPSDRTTCLANDDKIAYATTILVSNGNYGCKNIDTGTSLGCLFLFASTEQFEDGTAQYLGMPFGEFIHENKAAIIDCLNSYAYASPSDRKVYEDAISAITDPAKLKEFKSKQEDKNRSSMNQIVKRAWGLAEHIQK